LAGEFQGSPHGAEVLHRAMAAEGQTA
jgi:hypothetical protein